ncbi:MAG: efflux RND transporter permease subunit [Solitalea-like symbiont of Tyrophagus putrescentiae]
MKDIEKEFKGSSWAIDNKTSIYVITIIIAIAGLFAYKSLSKEQFPEVVFPQIYVATVYEGVSPENIENLITKQIEKQVRSIAGVKKITSSSVQSFSSIIVEFNTNIVLATALNNVRTAVDRARMDLPTDLKQEPQVIEIDVSQIPIMNINLSGDLDLSTLKKYADNLKDSIENFSEITRVDIIGALDREIQVNVDMYKMMSSQITFDDIIGAIARENINITGGFITSSNIKRTVTVNGQYKSAEDIADIIVRGASGANFFLKDIAEVKDSYKERETFARLDGKNVITLNVIKRSGENLIEASDKIVALCNKLKATDLPDALKITITGDQSEGTRTTLHDLINTIVIGFTLVTLILMFFMGTVNALFVAVSVPLSMAIAFLVISVLGFSLNMIVLFAFLLALGIVVDDAIVVIENTHRIFNNGKIPIIKAAKIAAGEVFMPVLSGTLTTLAPFVPLAFWQGVIGKFMFYLPITLIISLLASLVVAYIINPVFAVSFMKPSDPTQKDHKLINKKFKKISIVFFILIILGYLISFGFGNFVLLLYILYLFDKFLLIDIIHKFQSKTWPKIQDFYKKILIKSLTGKRPIYIFISAILLLLFSVVLVGIRGPKVVFFPDSDPNFIYTYIRLPIGTDQLYTDKITREVEQKIYTVIGEKNHIVKSVISNVGLGASDSAMDSQQTQSHLGKVTVAFVQFADRQGKSTSVYLDKIRATVKTIPGAEISVEKEQNGPPTGKPINIEISGDKFSDIISTAQKLKEYLNKSDIGGIEELKSDFESNKPEIIIDIDREKAGRAGIYTDRIGKELRTAIFGWEASKFREAKEDYPINVRLQQDQRQNITDIMNMKITYTDPSAGGLRQIPLASLAKVQYSYSYTSIKRKNQKRMITLSSNILGGYNANEVVANISKSLIDFPKPTDVSIAMTGEQEDQAETGSFLSTAMLISIGLIFIILVTQFNSLSKPIIILSEILFSITGVLLGFAIFKMDISIVMTGIGIIALAGIVVRNGIILVEFADLLISQGQDLKSAVIEAGRTRMTPVILTALSTILGLVPLAVGLNIDFIKLFTDLNPHIFFGGDSVSFWGPLSWTMIFGLIFSTILTLILVPIMYYLVAKIKLYLKKDNTIKI